MNKKKTTSIPSLTTKQLAYCSLRAQGENKAQSYLKAGYKASNSTQAGSAACKLEDDHRVSNYISTLRDAGFAKQLLSLQEKRAFLARAVRADVSSPDADLIQEMVETHGESGSSKRIKLVSKLEAINIDNKMAGHEWRDSQTTQQTNPFLFLVSLSRQTADSLAQLGERHHASTVDVETVALHDAGDAVESGE